MSMFGREANGGLQGLKSLCENSKFAPSAAEAARFICRDFSRGLKPALPRINAGLPQRN
jgi:hypothetical protein